MPGSTSARRTLSTADERREEVLAAAEKVFAARGLEATPTMDVAKAAGISQAYLFRLFPTKSDLAVALVQRCNQRIQATFAAAAARANASGEDVVPAMGAAYRDLITDSNLLLLQLHAHAASVSRPEIRDAMRDGFRQLFELVTRESGASEDDVKRFFARGMLLNVLGALGAFDLDEPWAQVLAAPPGD